MKRIIQILVVVIAAVFPLSAQTGVVSGLVVDRVTKEGLPGANIMVQGSSCGTAVDSEGRFILPNIPVGTVAIRVSLVGYVPRVLTDIVVTNKRSVELNIELEPTVVESKEGVDVRADYFQMPREIVMSAQALRFEEIRRAPGAAADISRMVQSLPGVVQTSDSRNDLIVRGGSPAENLNVIDGFEFGNINHFGVQGTSGGAIGMLQTEFISEATFLSGGFPARFGDRMSSVLDIRLREGSRESVSGSADVSMAGAGFIAEGPAGERASFMVAARRSYLDLFMNSIAFAAVPKYSNFTGKASWQATDKDKVSVLLLGGRDNIHIQQDPEGSNADIVSDDVDMRGEQYLTGLSWQHVSSAGSMNTVHAWTSRNEYEAAVNDFTRQPATMVHTNNSSEALQAVRLTRTASVGMTGEFQAGFALRRISTDYRMKVNADTSWNGIAHPALDVDRTGVATKGDAFVQYTYRPDKQITYSVGTRLNYFDAIADHYSFDTRFSFSYPVLPTLCVKLSAAVVHQSPELLWIEGSAVPNRSLKFLEARHGIVGLEYYPSEDSRLSMEGYRKEYRNYPVSSIDHRMSLANSGDTFAPNQSEGLTSEGTGSVVGVDLFAQKKLTESFYGMASLSISRTRHRALDGVERNGSYDIPCVMTMVGGYKINGHWEISSKFRFVSGRPHSRIDDGASRAAHDLRYDMNYVNAERYPNYWRWDVRIDYRATFDGWNLVAYLDFQNVTNRENIWGYAWNRVANDRISYRQMGLFPVGGVKVEL